MDRRKCRSSFASIWRIRKLFLDPSAARSKWSCSDALFSWLSHVQAALEEAQIGPALIGGVAVKTILAGLLVTIPCLAQPVVIDAAGPFLQFWQKHSHETQEQKRQAFQSEVVPLVPELYARLLEYGGTAENSRESLEVLAVGVLQQLLESLPKLARKSHQPAFIHQPHTDQVQQMDLVFSSERG